MFYYLIKYISNTRHNMFMCVKSKPFSPPLQAEDPASLTNMEADERRTGLRRIELMEFSNNLGYKELGRLDAAGYTYRIPKVEAQ